MVQGYVPRYLPVEHSDPLKHSVGFYRYHQQRDQPGEWHQNTWLRPHRDFIDSVFIFRRNCKLHCIVESRNPVEMPIVTEQSKQVAFTCKYYVVIKEVDWSQPPKLECLDVRCCVNRKILTMRQSITYIQSEMQILFSVCPMWHRIRLSTDIFHIWHNNVWFKRFHGNIE